MANEIVLVRHGETDWSRRGQHTSRTDLPLSDEGQRQAGELAARLAGRVFSLVLTSPLQRASQTCTLAGYGAVAVSTPDLAEWDYGAYEGRTTSEIRTDVPGWSLWADGAPDGETIASVAERADRVLRRLEEADGDALVFSHGHFLRVLAARWLELDATSGRFLALATASISALGWEREQRVLTHWNLVA